MTKDHALLSSFCLHTVQHKEGSSLYRKILGYHRAGNELCRPMLADPVQVQYHSFKSHLSAVPCSLLLSLSSHAFQNIILLNYNSLMPKTVRCWWRQTTD